MNIYALCATTSARDLLRLLCQDIPLKGIIGLSQRKPNDIPPGYCHFAEEAAKIGVDYIEVESYSLTNTTDINRLEALNIDLLFVLGWQRLIPGWLINQCCLGSVGIHGSSNGITGGRGRSPQNWALHFGERDFFISLFFIDPGVDSGPVIDTRRFPITPLDDIRSSYIKVVLLSAEMIKAAYRSNAFSEHRAEIQPNEARYLPKRGPEDCGIDWHRGTREIYNFIRALTKPYFGAFSRVEDATIIIWRARPLEFEQPLELRGLNEQTVPGMIIAQFGEDSLLICTGDGWLLVDEFEIRPPSFKQQIMPGMVLESVNYSEQMVAIARRHIAACPALPLIEKIQMFLGNMPQVKHEDSRPK